MPSETRQVKKVGFAPLPKRKQINLEAGGFPGSSAEKEKVGGCLAITSSQVGFLYQWRGCFTGKERIKGYTTENLRLRIIPLWGLRLPGRRGWKLFLIDNFRVGFENKDGENF